MKQNHNQTQTQQNLIKTNIISKHYYISYLINVSHLNLTSPLVSQTPKYHSNMILPNHPEPPPKKHIFAHTTQAC